MTRLLLILGLALLTYLPIIDGVVVGQQQLIQSFRAQSVPQLSSKYSDFPFGFSYITRSEPFCFDGGVIVDFNHDGRLDYVGLVDVRETPAGRLIVFTQNDSGYFTIAREYYGEGARSLDVADINGDGLFDIATTGPFHPGSEATLNIYYQRASGDFDRAYQFCPGKSPRSICIGDLNNDGLPDIAVSFYEENFLRVFYQGQDQSFIQSRTRTLPGAFPAFESPMKIVDLNNDNRNDLFVLWAQNQDSTFGVYLQQADGSLPLSSIHSWPSIFTNDFAIADFDGDGNLDLALPFPANRPYGHIAVFPYDPVKDFSDTPYVYFTLDNPANVALGDFDKDGREDMVLFHTRWPSATYFHSAASGMFDASYLAGFQFTDAPYQRREDVGDINGDGWPDIIYADYQFGLTVLYNSTHPITGIVTPKGDKGLEFHLEQNYPNPFNSSTAISFTLPEEACVKLDIFNTLGQRVAQLIDKPLGAGNHDVQFDGSRLATGVYLYRLQAGRFVAARRLLLMR